ncbi:DUF1573 domain-containing protein [Algibacter miyuki]|uniref:DUF1573 domain-containing protein n=1 Tax=Algibacter miyuki TaxID=1306933 RepID=A0ABV5H1Z6_9FLAO|nr:DUF1573 domain-containing protein [Algibacter miyuki]MDN3666533.1 DUF1573 domain-containing protein [Algibacter miyuki]MDN3667719.1 DUF1573 domain-containing protein [Algibacter miyuki]
MKKVILGLSTLCLVAFTSCKNDNAAKKIEEANVTAAAVRDAVSSNFPVITFNETTHDFGEIEANKSVETVFSYTNTGDAPLVITNIATTCGCTVPQDWSREPLAVGETGKFTVKYNGSGKGKVSKSLTLTANTEKGKEVVKITAFVKTDDAAISAAIK